MDIHSGYQTSYLQSTSPTSSPPLPSGVHVDERNAFILAPIQLNNFTRGYYSNVHLGGGGVSLTDILQLYSNSTNIMFTTPINLFDPNFPNHVEDSAGGSGIPFDFIINGIGITIIAFLGIIGNILSMIVLSRPQMKSSVTCLLLGLAFCDTLLISISILIFGLPSISDFTGALLTYKHVYYPLLVPYLFPISITAQTGSVYLTLAVTIERYVAVCHPLRARSLLSWRRALICVLTVISLAILYNLPRWFEVCTVVEEPEAINEAVAEIFGNLTLYGVTMCPMRDSLTYKLIYINWMYLIVMYLIPFTGLVVFNWTIYRQVRKANRERAVMSKLQRRELGLATMLLFVVGVFLLCNVLPLVNNILESFYDQSIDQLVQFSNFLVIFNSSVNFVIYCTCGERFRKLLVKLCHDCVLCCLTGRSDKRKSSLFRKSKFYRGRHGGDFEEMSMGSVGNNHTVVTNNYSRSTSVSTAKSLLLSSSNKSGQNKKGNKCLANGHNTSLILKHNDSIPTVSHEPNPKILNDIKRNGENENGGNSLENSSKSFNNKPRLDYKSNNNCSNNGVIIGNAINRNNNFINSGGIPYSSSPT